MADLQEELKKLNDTQDDTASMDSADVESNKIMAILAYLGILVLIPILAAPTSKFAKYHSNQGLVLLICGIVISVVGMIPILGTIIGFVGGLCEVVLMVIGIINAATGKAKQLPIIGKFTILK